VGGSAIVIALDRLLDQARPLAAQLLDTEPDAVIWEDGRFTAPGGDAVSLTDVASLAYRPQDLPPGIEVGLHAEARFRSPLVFGSGAYVASVEIERRTGIMRIVHLACVDDGGTVINRLLAHGQVVGGVAQGLGECLVEEAVHDEAGQLRTASFADYSLLTAADMPPLAVGVVETPSPHNPLGAKGLGEGGAIGSLPAVANAVADALGGRHLDPPYTAEKLWRALREDAN
jgi:carbon-monoxide dehydrogenase large subunit